MNQNSLLYWYPKIKNLNIPQPKTKVVLLEGKEFEETMEGMPKSLVERVKDLIKDEFRLPVFIRTDQASGKHYWKDTCYYDGSKGLARHLFEICEYNHCAGFLGLNFEAIIVREYIPMASKFVAFRGNMPVNPERRYFVNNGKVLCRHPYWFKDSIQPNSKRQLPSNWKSLIKKMNRETVEEIELLTKYSEEVGQYFEGYWSIDFCKAKDGRWILIDMALGKNSWHPDCKLKIK